MNPRFILALVLSATPTLGQARLVQAQKADDPPKAETILDRFVEVTGGKAAYARVKDRTVEGKIEIKGTGISGKMTIAQANQLMLTKVEFEQLGTTIQGVNKDVAWEVSPITGPRILEGDEKASSIRESNLDNEPEWRKYYTKAETKGVEDVDGKAAYKVELTPKDGAAVTNFYDKQSGLLVRSDRVIKSPMGEIAVQTYLSDYKKVGEVLLPHKSKQTVLTQEVDLTFEKFKVNSGIPADTFKLPEEVQKLVDKKK